MNLRAWLAPICEDRSALLVTPNVCAQARASAPVACSALLGGATAALSPNRGHMTTLSAPGPKCPSAQAASNDHGNPRNPHGYVEDPDLHRPLIQSPHSLKRRYQSEENTRNDDILTRHFDPPVYQATPNVCVQPERGLSARSAATHCWAKLRSASIAT